MLKLASPLYPWIQGTTFRDSLGSDDSAEVLRVSAQNWQPLGATAFKAMAVTGFQDFFVTHPRPFVQTLQALMTFFITFIGGRCGIFCLVLFVYSWKNVKWEVSLVCLFVLQRKGNENLFWEQSQSFVTLSWSVTSHWLLFDEITGLHPVFILVTLLVASDVIWQLLHLGEKNIWANRWFLKSCKITPGEDMLTKDLKQAALQVCDDSMF